jgi:signal transduction histidine kinase
LSWIIDRRGWILPWLVFLLVVSTTAVLDNQLRHEQDARRVTAESSAQAQVSVLAESIGRLVSERMGALAIPKLRLAVGPDSISRQAFSASVDSVIREMSGLVAISSVSPDGRVTPSRDALLGRPGLDPAVDSLVRVPFLAALEGDTTTATRVIERVAGPRVIVFEPLVPPDGGAPVALLAAEIDPLTLYRVGLNSLPDTLRGGRYTLLGPDSVQISSLGTPPGWSTVDRPIRIADKAWTARLSYPPLDRTGAAGVRVAMWVAGLATAGALAAILTVLRGTVRRQRDEIARREEAERRAREAAAEARGLSAQLAAAHTAAQRLSTSLDPAYVLEFFLGTVGEVLRADAASLYTFDEEGDLIGRSRLVLRDAGPGTERLKSEDIRNVRVPAAMLPQLAAAVSTGEPQVVDDALRLRDATGISPGADSAASWVTIPLQVGGNMVGVAIWEVFGVPHAFDRKDVAFADALGAQAAAAMRTAELYASLQAASDRAASEAARFGAVLDQMNDAVVIADAGASLERFNDAAGEHLGARPANGDVQEWVRQLDLIGHDRRPVPASDFPLMRALRGETVRRVDVIARSPLREDRHLTLSATPIVTASGQNSGAAMIVRDNTDEQQYAEMLRHTNQELRKHASLLEQTNEQLRAATAAKDQFLAVVSHELRTPVNAIMGYAELLDLEIKGTLNADQKVMLRRLRSTAWHLLGLINEILDLPKVASGDVKLKLEKVELREVLDAALHQIAPIADTKGLEIRAIHGVGRGHKDLVAIADRRRLTQVVLNLLSNAVKFTEKGSVTLRSCDDGDGFVEVRVQDTGQGIPEDQQEKIFEEFYQIEGGLTRKVGGTGLGLAITRKFTRLMGGDVLVESRVGEGAEFIVRLPSAQA